jgi:hypothetical protein
MQQPKNIKYIKQLKHYNTEYIFYKHQMFINIADANSQ